MLFHAQNLPTILRQTKLGQILRYGHANFSQVVAVAVSGEQCGENQVAVPLMFQFWPHMAGAQAMIPATRRPNRFALTHV